MACSFLRSSSTPIACKHDDDMMGSGRIHSMSLDRMLLLETSLHGSKTRRLGWAIGIGKVVLCGKQRNSNTIVL